MSMAILIVCKGRGVRPNCSAVFDIQDRRIDKILDSNSLNAGSALSRLAAPRV